MTVWERLLRRACVAAAVLAVAACVAPRYGIVFVGGWSMSPTYVPGDLVVYGRLPTHVTERDIVLIESGDAPRGLVHRVVAVLLDGTLRTKGDANEHVDSTLAVPGDVVGVAVTAVPTGRLVNALAACGRWCYNHVPIANTRL